MIADDSTATLAPAPDASILAVRITAGALCVIGAVILIWQFFGYLMIFPGPFVVAIVVELPLLVIGSWLVRLLRPVLAPDRLWSAAALVWGATAATGCALLANEGLTALWAKAEGVRFASNWSSPLSAPLNEEVVKLCGVIMVVLAAPGVIRGPLDGMIYGALTGLGFQVVENITYGLDDITQTGATDPVHAVLSSVLLRVGTSGLGSHWAMTAVAGTGIGYLVSRGPGRAGMALAAAYLMLAMAMHLLFDAPHPALAIKVPVNFAIVYLLYLRLRIAYMARARTALAACIKAGTISRVEAAGLLSRITRWRQLHRAAPGAERIRLQARQQATLARVNAEAAGLA
jgi:protease PrsW